MQIADVGARTTEEVWNYEIIRQSNNGICGVSPPVSNERERAMKFYQRVVKLGHVSLGFHRHFFWVSTSFSGWTGNQGATES